MQQNAAPLPATTGLLSTTDAEPVTRFGLNGPLPAYDKRITPARGDLADIGLAGKIFASSYVAAVPHHCVMASAMLHKTASQTAEAVSQLRLGDGFAVLEMAGGWCWGYCLDDGYCGYVELSALARGTVAATHSVSARATLIFSEPDFKAPVVMRPAMGSQLSIAGEEGAFSKCEHGYLPSHHLAAIGTAGEDIATIAETLIDAPYLWGGRGGDGLDCSGLVQLVLMLKGVTSPRDSDQQEAALGKALEEDAPLQRNDLVFFPHHVGIMLDGEHIIHANSTAMCVSVDRLEDVVARPYTGGDNRPITARKRLTWA
ncbi:C40 family peptidase [Alterisphingorhabdus coralli]|uniref:C40 family peptidase n=1 Tax=Alterisphingorhabdus coralli TaxID=3071408 RepID=A0AA97I039_9SPHN|nr:C40 family peptidase [Parasphingorhabdus sp. SCSIO 66989]WOE74492.1 C40 family peptidase [Parasphingorhabdus sp. SCSIO 66989]